MNKDMSLRDIVHHVTKDIDVHGIDVLSDKISGHFAWFRAIELAFTLNRLRGLQVIQKDVCEIWIRHINGFVLTLPASGEN